MTVIQVSPWTGWPSGAVIELADDAAIALFSAIAAYRNETGRHDADSAPIVAPVGGRRTVAECAEMAQGFDLHRAGRAGWQGIYAKYNMDTASTARPSTTSPHVSGYCADIAPNAFLNWLIANGTRYGWRRTLVASNDLRHFQYFPGTATAALNVTSLDGSTDSAPAGPTPQQLLERIDPNMPTILHAPSGTMAIVVPFGSRVYTNGGEFSYQANAGTYPRLECATEDVLNTLVGEQNERDAVSVARVAAAVLAGLPASSGGTSSPTDAQLAAIVTSASETGAEEAVRKVFGALDGATPATPAT